MSSVGVKMAGTYLHQDRHFFEQRDQQSRHSAQAVIPIIMDMLAPRSVVDLGCGVGTWLAVFHEHGVQRVLGVEGGEVDLSLLRIAPEAFQRADLSKPFAFGQSFDLAMSLEVAEHLPESSANDFVASLVKLAPAVLFSAAVPHQGGIHHVNEQWPQYWVDRFATHQYQVLDAIRPRIWHDPQVQAWYAQNTFLFVRQDLVDANPKLSQARQQTRMHMLDLIHPQYVQWKADDRDRLVAQARELTLGIVLRQLPTLLRKSLASRWRKMIG